MALQEQTYRGHKRIDNKKADVHFKIEQLLIEKQKYIDDQLSSFNVFEQTSDVIKLIHQQAAEKYDDQLESLHQLYNKL